MYGEFHHLYAQLRENENEFVEYLRVDFNTFDYICEAVTPLVTKKDTNWRKAIGVVEMLVITLR